MLQFKAKIVVKDSCKYVKCFAALCCALLLFCGCGTADPAPSTQAVNTQSVSSVVETSEPVKEELSD